MIILDLWPEIAVWVILLIARLARRALIFTKIYIMICVEIDKFIQ